MITKLPTTFLHKMNRLLQDEYPSFLASYEDTRVFGLRRNPLKISSDVFERQVPFGGESIPWSEEGYYLNEGDRPGKHPYYHAGLYYIQEPSAMAPVELLDVKPGDKVLDLCGAPGGKSTQIAGKLGQQGVLVANDNHPDRVKAMVKNLELFGVKNAVVVNDLPERLAQPFAQYFDKILVDAPCSGEGMFRKEPEMTKSWNEIEVSRYASMQRAILISAAKMLRPGGRMVYSTCTFSPEENEATIAEFLKEHSQFRVVKVPYSHGFAAGRPEWLNETPVEGVSQTRNQAVEATRDTVRLWPHLVRGEGHYVAVLERDNEPDVIPASNESEQVVHRPNNKAKTARVSKSSSRSSNTGDAPSAVVLERFWSEHFVIDRAGQLELRGDYVYQVPPDIPDLSGIKVVRPGWFLGSIRKERFEPSQALAMGVQADQTVRRVDLNGESADVIRYLKGETLHLPDSALVRSAAAVPVKGYTLMCIDGYPLGWAKWQDGMLKNEYPPGWRWT